jgi:hypothetical protein
MHLKLTAAGGGEEWPDEEDLPGGGTSDSSSSYDGIMSKSLQKDTKIAMQRNQKLKIAKRNSKM